MGIVEPLACISEPCCLGLALRYMITMSVAPNGECAGVIPAPLHLAKCTAVREPSYKEFSSVLER